MGKKQDKKPGLFTKVYGGKGYKTPTAQDTGVHFGRGAKPKPRPIRPFGKGV